MSVEAAGTVRWERLDASVPAQLQEVGALAQRAFREVGLGARAYELPWRLGADADWKSLEVFVLRQAGSVLGFAIFARRRLPLKFQIGEVSLARVQLTRYWHLGEPWLDTSLTGDAAVEACAQLLVSVLSLLRSRECLFLEGMPEGGPLQKALNSANARAASVRLQLGEPFEHQFITMPDSFAAYLQQLGSRSRQSVQYSQRRLLKDMEGDVKCECFETEESIDRFVADAVTVSRKTYQWNLLGLGLRDAEALTATLKFSARNGWARSFLLYCKGTPVAFMLGSQHGDAYYYDDVGYDPDYAKQSVGTVLQLMVLEFLLGRDDRPKYFDFSTGYGEHKGRFGNMSRREVNLLVMPATLANRTLVRSHRLTDSTSQLAASVLERVGVKDKLKRLIRRLSGRKSAPA